MGAVGASILGSAPQLPPAPGPMYGGSQQPRMVSPGPPFSNQPPPPPPPQMNVVPGSFIQPPQQHQAPQQQPPLTQSSLLGQPPMNPHVFAGSGGPPPAFQTIGGRPPAPPIPPACQGIPVIPTVYGHPIIEGALPLPPPSPTPGGAIPQSAGLIQQQPPQGPSPFGINLVPFPSSVEPSPIGTSGSQPHPLPLNTGAAAGVGGDMPKFGLPMMLKPGGSIGGAEAAVPSDTAHMFTTAAGIPQFENVGGPPPPPPPTGVITSRAAGGPETLFNHLNLGQLGAMGGGTESIVTDESSQSPSFQQAANGFHQYPYLHQPPNQDLLTPSSSLTSVGGGGGVVFTPSSNFIVMTPGVFTTANAGFTSSVQQSSSQPPGVEGGDGLLPIGTERAHKSSPLPTAFSMLAPGMFVLYYKRSKNYSTTYLCDNLLSYRQCLELFRQSL